MLRRLTCKLRPEQSHHQSRLADFSNERESSALINAIHDWQITHGLVLKHRDRAVPIGVSLIPTPFPKHLFAQAQSLQKVYNELYIRISGDEKWLSKILRSLMVDDPFAATLMQIHLEVTREGLVQDLTLGIFRSDYMLHHELTSSGLPEAPTIKQVEFNSLSVAGGIHANHVAEMHQHMSITGMFHEDQPDMLTQELPSNSTIDAFVAGLAKAHRAYGPPKSKRAQETVILFTVQPFNYNVADERAVEYGLWNQDPPIPAYRVIFRPEVLAYTSLTDSKELLYHPPFRQGLSPMEVSVVYHRAGYDASEYDRAGCAARLHLERSRAIKCPSILCHLAGFKKVQQALSVPGPAGLEHFIAHEETRMRISSTFGRMYTLDNDTELGMHGRALANDLKTAANHVLKPSREGGGHNIYRDAIPAFLKTIPQSKWHTYILMELFNSPKQQGTLLTPKGRYEGPVISELGMFGVCLWRTNDIDVEILENEAAGWSFKTKASTVDEMSVVKGYGCFDCPRLTSP